MSRSNDGLPMLPPWLADTEVTGVGQGNFRTYEPPPVENLPQDQVIPETPEPANGFFNRRGRGEDRSESSGEKKKGKGWFRNRNRDEPPLEERVGQLLPGNNGPRPAQRNNWAEASSQQQWTAQPDAAGPESAAPTAPPHPPDPKWSGGPSGQPTGPGARPGQFAPGGPDPANPSLAPDDRPPWGPGPGAPPQAGHPGAPPHPGPPSAPPGPTDPQSPPPPDQPGPGQYTAPAGPGPGATGAPGAVPGQAPTPDRPDLPLRTPNEPAPEFDRLRPHHPIGTPAAPEGPATAAAPADSTFADPATTDTGSGAAYALPDPPPAGGAAPDPGPAGQRPLRRLPDLPPPPSPSELSPAPDSSGAPAASGAPTAAASTSTSEVGHDRPDSAPAAHGSGAPPIAEQPRADGSADTGRSRAEGPSGPASGPLTVRGHGAAPAGAETAPADEVDSSGPPSSQAPAGASGPAERAPEAAARPGHPATESTSTDSGHGGPAPQWRAPEQSTARQYGPQHPVPQNPGPPPPQQGGPAPHNGPMPQGGPALQAGPAPHGHQAQHGGPTQHSAPTPPGGAAPYDGPMSQGGPARQTGPGRHGGPAPQGAPMPQGGPTGGYTSGPAQWQHGPAPSADPSVQQGGPAQWQQQDGPAGPQGGQWQQPVQGGVPGPGGPSLDNVPVRRAKKASGSGWRKVVHHASGGKINPGMSAEERRLQELVARIRQPVRGDYRIAVLSLKGGVGKTTTTIGLGSTFSSVRGDRVIAVDANPDFGTLSQRVPLQTRSTVRDLLLDPAIQRYSDVRRHTSQATSRLEVLASERDPAASEAFNEDEYRAVARILQRFYNIILTDCGTGLMHSAMAGVLQLAHSLVLISPTAIDGAQSASATLDWLSLHGYHHLVENAVVVINSPREGTPNIDVQQLRQYFLSRCRAVHMIPFDPHMSEGAEIDLTRLEKKTKRAYVELAATVADDFGRSYRMPQG